MILPVILLFLCGTWTVSSLEEGEACTLADGGAGICTILNNCQSVYQDLMSDKPGTVSCGYVDYNPVVCCPKNRPTPVITDRIKPRVDLVGDGRGAIARKKCAEYAKFVYVQKYVARVGGIVQQIPVSQCAVKSQKLITGGTKAERMEFPHMTAVGYNSEGGGISWLCGGTLISENYVLTAAHCTYSNDLGPATYVRLGDLNLVKTDDGATPVNIRITELINHPQYEPPAQYHDIALLRLERNVIFNGWIRPACLRTAPDTGTENAIATGWGRIEWISGLSDDLLKVVLPLVEPETCEARWARAAKGDAKLPNGVNTDWMICAAEKGKDTCQGDSGGPLVIFSNASYYCMYDVVGVTSLGRYCGSNFPSIYTRVYHYVSWIESVVWPEG